MKTSISAIILKGGKIDDLLYRKCLDSLSFVDEKVIVDTSKIKGSFADWRNYGAKKAKSDWLLYVDIDEQVTPPLAKTVLQVVTSDDFSGYAIPRRNIFLGHTMRWGGWYPDYVLRLIKKDKLIRWEGDLHEQPKIKGEICHLKSPLIHNSHRSLSEMIEKTNEWSEIEARLLFDSGHPKMNFFRFFTAGFREFWYRGIRNLGFLDGTTGVIETIYQTFSRLITYSKLWELQLKYTK
ncbi:MAG: glycosyltransferase family 2 protein [Candidatus Woesebacteria bacterium]|nr:MAG: glycosyltransferase family 2 protein [Candidatus Woesebacteria bacterium]